MSFNGIRLLPDYGCKIESVLEFYMLPFAFSFLSVCSSYPPKTAIRHH